MPEPRFLVVRLGSLGDIVHAFPAVSGLRRSFPEGRIVWLVHPKWERLVSASMLASEVWTVDTRNWRGLSGVLGRIRAHRFDAAVDYQGLWKSAAIPFLGGVRRRIGFSKETVRERGVPLLYTDAVRVLSTHVADRNGELSSQAGAREPVGEVKLRIAADDETRVREALAKEGISEYVVLSPGGGWRSKCWPPERYGALADEIFRALGLRSVINAGPGEEPLVLSVQQAAKAARAVAYRGNLGQLMALLKGSRAVVAGDTGPLHLADALGVPVVALFGPTDPARNGPYRRSGVVLRWEGAATTYKRGSETDESLKHIRVEEVLGALRGLRDVA